jgi:hypothetical protein
MIGAGIANTTDTFLFSCPSLPGLAERASPGGAQSRLTEQRRIERNGHRAGLPGSSSAPQNEGANGARHAPPQQGCRGDILVFAQEGRRGPANEPVEITDHVRLVRIGLRGNGHCGTVTPAHERRRPKGAVFHGEIFRRHAGRSAGVSGSPLRRIVLSIGMRIPPTAGRCEKLQPNPPSLRQPAARMALPIGNKMHLLVELT